MKKLHSWERWGVLALLLFAWTLRWVALFDVPPGWRDDDLIEVYTFSKEILHSGPVLYFTGAEGHEPLYHTIRAPLLAVAGVNLASVRWLAASYSLLSILLTWAVGRRLFTREVGLLSGSLVAVSFWSLMYSRVAIRHIATLPPTLLALYWGWRQIKDPHPPRLTPLGIMSGTGAALLTYYAGRLVPVLLFVTLPLLTIKKGERGPKLRRLSLDYGRWKGYLLGLGGGLLLAAPMFWMIPRLMGADARISAVGVPLNALREGQFGPVLQTTWTTLGMFHATGDPEWLYNIAGRPVFSWLGATVFYLGILTRLAHLDQANARLVLCWLVLGIAPAFISYPPSSLGHTIVALPAVYLLLTMPMKAAARRWQWTTLPLFTLTLIVVGVRDLHDYFIRWPQASMTHFLYRADYRALAQHLDTHSDIQDAVASSFLFGPWDRLAVDTDLHREDMRLRWVNPERALLGRSDGTPLPFYFQEEQPQLNPISHLVNNASPLPAPEGLHAVALSLPPPPAGSLKPGIKFENALILQAISWDIPPAPGKDTLIAIWWEVLSPLPLPPEKLIPHEPPPGVYSGPRLKIFAHLLAQDETFLIGDDGLWVHPYTLQTGDQFIQWQRFSLPADAPAGPYTLALGLYDPLTGERWTTSKGKNQVMLQIKGP